MTHKDVLNLNASLMSIPVSNNFNIDYAIEKNIELLKIEIRAIDKLKQPILDILKPFEDARVQLCEELVLKIEGVMQFNPDRTYKFTEENQKQLADRMAKLKVKHKKIIDLAIKKEEPYQKFLDETSKFKPYYILKKNIPENLSGAITKAIFPLIREKE